MFERFVDKIIEIIIGKNNIEIDVDNLKQEIEQFNDEEYDYEIERNGNKIFEVEDIDDEELLEKYHRRDISFSSNPFHPMYNKSRIKDITDRSGG